MSLLSPSSSSSRPFSAGAGGKVRQPVALQKHRLGAGGYPVIRASARTLDLADPQSPSRIGPPPIPTGLSIVRTPSSPLASSPHYPHTPARRPGSPGGGLDSSSANTPVHHKDPYVESLISAWVDTMSPIISRAQQPTLEGLKAALKHPTAYGARGVLRGSAELQDRAAYLHDDWGGPRPATAPAPGSPARRLRRLAGTVPPASGAPKGAAGKAAAVAAAPPKAAAAVDAEEAALAAEMAAPRQRRKPYRVDFERPRMTRAAIMREGNVKDRMRDFELWRLRAARQLKEEAAPPPAANEIDPFAAHRRASMAADAEELDKANFAMRKAAMDEERAKYQEFLREEIASFIVQRPTRKDAVHEGMRKRTGEEDEHEAATRARFGLPSREEVKAIGELPPSQQARKLQHLEEDLVTKMAETLRTGDEESFLAIYDLIPDIFESKKVYEMKARARRLAGLAAFTKTSDETFTADGGRVQY